MSKLSIHSTRSEVCSTMSTTFEVSEIVSAAHSMRAEAARMSVRMSTRRPASARMDWAAETISDPAKGVDMVEQTSALVEWIDRFDMNSILELDLGGVSDVLWPTEAPELVDSWVTALSNDDTESARAAFQKYAAGWEQLNLYARGS